MRLFLLALLVVAMAPVCFAQKPDDDKPADRSVAVTSPFVGTWDYVVRPDDPVAEGTFTITQSGDVLGGVFRTDAPRDILPFEADADTLAFTFKQPDMGDIVIRGTLDGNAFEGTAEAEGQEALPFVATRQSATETADQ